MKKVYTLIYTTFYAAWLLSPKIKVAGVSMKLTTKIEEVQGRLDTLDENAFSQIDFEWEGMRFRAVSSARSDGGDIRLKASIGRLFYTIEDGNARAQSIEHIYNTNRTIDGAYMIKRNGDVTFESLTTTNKQLCGSDLISALTVILLECETHLRLLRSFLRPLAV